MKIVWDQYQVRVSSIFETALNRKQWAKGRL
jgi:predicted transcriptional regulator